MLWLAHSWAKCRPCCDDSDKINTPRVPGDSPREALTGSAHGRGIDNRHHLFKHLVLHQSMLCFVGIPDVTQVNMLIDFVLTPDTGSRAFGLFFNRLDDPSSVKP